MTEAALMRPRDPETGNEMSESAECLRVRGLERVFIESRNPDFGESVMYGVIGVVFINQSQQVLRKYATLQDCDWSKCRQMFYIL